MAFKIQGCKLKVLPPKLIMLRPAILIDVEVWNNRTFDASHPAKGLLPSFIGPVRTRTVVFHGFPVNKTKSTCVLGGMSDYLSQKTDQQPELLLYLNSTTQNALLCEKSLATNTEFERPSSQISVRVRFSVRG